MSNSITDKPQVSDLRLLLLHISASTKTAANRKCQGWSRRDAPLTRQLTSTVHPAVYVPGAAPSLPRLRCRASAASTSLPRVCCCASGQRSLAPFLNRDTRQLGKHDLRFTETDKERGQRGLTAMPEGFSPAWGLIPCDTPCPKFALDGPNSRIRLVSPHGYHFFTCGSAKS